MFAQHALEKIVETHGLRTEQSTRRLGKELSVALAIYKGGEVIFAAESRGCGYSEAEHLERVRGAAVEEVPIKLGVAVRVPLID